MKKYLLYLILLLPVTLAAQAKIDPCCYTNDKLLSDTTIHLYDRSTSRATSFSVYENFHLPKYYLINWKKIKTLNDLKAVMSEFYFFVPDNQKNFKKIKKYLIITK